MLARPDERGSRCCDDSRTATRGDARVNLARRTNRDIVIEASSPQPAPRWALLERQLLDAQNRACEQFFARYVSLNSFTETVIRSRQRGEIMRWKPQLGKRQLI